MAKPRKRTAGHPDGASPSTPDPASSAPTKRTKTPKQDTGSETGETSEETSRQAPGTVSHAQPPGATEGGNGGDRGHYNQLTEAPTETGNVPPLPPTGDAVGETAARETADQVRARVWARFNREKRDIVVITEVRDEMMRATKKTMKDREERFRWVYGELDRMYPPMIKADNVRLPAEPPTPVQADNVRLGGTSDGQIQGLNCIPDGWPELPSNASISTEVAWVQANRLRVVEERPGRATMVHLDKAMSPAPSWAALGWLETSVRSYAKFVDVAAKVSGSGDEEGAVMRRERMAVDEVRGLLDEMMEDAASRAQG